MKIISTTVYDFDELSDSAKEKAREWYRDGALDYEWWDSTYEDASNIGLKIKSFDLDRNRHATGDFTISALDVAAKIVADHGKDCETFKTAQRFVDERVETFKLHFDEDAENQLTLDGEHAIEDCEAEFLKSILEDYSILLQRECEYILSDKAVDESILANGYTFTESGKRAG